jgi:guanylate kinase
MPPSFEILEQRLRGRGTESEESIQRRLSAAKSELMKYNLFDYIVFNDDVDRATAEVVSIIDAEKRRVKNNLGEIQLILDSKKQ